MRFGFKSALSIIGFLLLMGFSYSSLNAAASSDEQLSRIVEAAKKEGQLNTCGLPDVTHPAIIEAFNKRYPEIKVSPIFSTMWAMTIWSWERTTATTIRHLNSTPCAN